MPTLLDGISITTLAVGLFAMGETLYVASRFTGVQEKIEAVRGSLWMTLDDWKRSWKAWLRGFGLGFPIGALPAGGAEVPTLLSYTIERKLDRRPEQFGNGAIEGVAGPEAANNAAATGTLVPLLTLGLPTSATAAMMLAGFQQYGIVPGPLLFVSNTELVWGLIASFFIGNLMLLVLNLPLGRPVGAVAEDPAAVPLGGHPGLCGNGHGRGQSVESEIAVAGGVWHAGLLDALLGLSGRADDRGPDPRADGRRPVPARAADQPGRLVGVLQARRLGDPDCAHPLALVAPLIFKGLRRFKTDDA